MIILDKPYTVKELNEIKPYANGFVKGVVDLNQELIALDADMHYELADYLKEQRGSKEIDMWGLYRSVKKHISLIQICRKFQCPFYLISNVYHLLHKG